MALDPRINAFRTDLADIRLQEKVEAKRYVTGTPGTVIVPICNLRMSPSLNSPLGTQALLGEALLVFETKDGWHWVQSEVDGYVGYALANEIDLSSALPTSHTVTAPLAHVYPQADIKTHPLEVLPMGAKFSTVGAASDTWLTLARGGYIKTAATRPWPAKDMPEIAARLLGTPYLWGGSTALGIDCSGLIQLAFHASGQPCPRDSDQQEAALGKLIPPGEPLRRGDLIFFKGHVGIMCDETKLLHANATWMRTVIEPLVETEKREPITSRKRIS